MPTEACLESIPLGVVDWAAWSQRGPSHKVNEDAWGVDGERLFAVADGVGVEEGGQLAASHVIERFLDATSTMDEVRTREISRSVQDASSEHGFADAKSTFTSLSMNQAGNHLLTHVGDSRAYLVRSSRVQRLTTDHNLDLLRRSGADGPDSVGRKQSGSLFSWMGQRHGPKRVDVAGVDLVSEDLLFLTTDGVHRAIALPRLIIGMHAEDSCATIISAIADAVNTERGSDDATVVVLRIGTAGAVSGSCRSGDNEPTFVPCRDLENIGVEGVH